MAAAYAAVRQAVLGELEQPGAVLAELALELRDTRQPFSSLGETADALAEAVTFSALAQAAGLPAAWLERVPAWLLDLAWQSLPDVECASHAPSVAAAYHAQSGTPDCRGGCGRADCAARSGGASCCAGPCGAGCCAGSGGADAPRVGPPALARDRLEQPRAGRRDGPRRLTPASLENVFEAFAHAAWPDRRREQGVFFTPPALVRAQVRLAADLLARAFGCHLGFGDPRVGLVDPATGEAAYVLAAIADVAGRGAAPALLADRLEAFEPRPGAAGLARARLAAALGGTRARVRVADALAARVELRAPILVCLGNPPYRRGPAAGVRPFLERASSAGPSPGVHRKNVYNAYVYFWQWALEQVLEARSGPGIVSFVTPASFLGGPGFGGMRAALRQAFDELWLLDLGGDGRGARPSENVFGVRTPVVVGMGARYAAPRPALPARVWYARLEGTRAAKLAALDALASLDDVDWTPVGPAASACRPWGASVPANAPSRADEAARTAVAGDDAGQGASQADPGEPRPAPARGAGGDSHQVATPAPATPPARPCSSAPPAMWRDVPGEPPRGWSVPLVARRQTGYHVWPRLTDLFPVQLSGCQLKRTWPIAPSPELLRRRWARLLELDPDQRAAAFRPSRDRDVYSRPPDLREPGTRLPALAELPADAAPVEPVPYAYRSFDRQWVLPDARLGDFMRPRLWHIAGPHQVFLTSLLTGVLGPGPAAVATALVPDLDHFRGSFGGRAVIPVWLDAEATQPNVDPAQLEQLEHSLGLTITPDDLLAACYALLATPAYARRFHAELAEPGPRVPLPTRPAVFRRATELGKRLLCLHTFGARCFGTDCAEHVGPEPTVFAQEAHRASSPATGESEPRPCQPAAAGRARVLAEPTAPPQAYAYRSAARELWVGDARFGPVEPRVWDFSISGLGVVRSWLRYRMPEPKRRGSPLDDLRPDWTPATSAGLLELLWLLEATLDLEAALEAMLDDAIACTLAEAPSLPWHQRSWTRPSPPPAEAPAPLASDTLLDEVTVAATG